MILYRTHTGNTDNAERVCTEPVIAVIRLGRRPLVQHLRRVIQGLGIYLIKKEGNVNARYTFGGGGTKVWR